MATNETIRLLILNDSREEAERLISMLRNAGRPTRAQHVESEEILAKLLEEQAWDLLIGHFASTKVQPAAAIKQVKRLSKDVPVILLTEEEGSHPVVEGMKLGAVDVVRIDEDQHLLLVIGREMDNREQRQNARRAARQFKEAERRSQQLLDSSRDAIAYVQDGMYLYANESFAELFGYDDRDDIECMPIIDMIEPEDQDNVKSFLKDFAIKGDDGESTALQFRGQKADGSMASYSMEVAYAIYDEEPCIQFMIRASMVNNEELEAQINLMKDQDVTTGLYNRQFIVNELNSLINRADEGAAGAFLCMEVDNFVDNVQGAVGMAGSDKVLSQVARILQEKNAGQGQLARFADNAFCLLLPNCLADKAIAVGQSCCEEVAKQIFDVDNRTLQATLSVGVAIINETVGSSESVIDQCLKAISDLRKENEGNGTKLFERELEAGSEEEIAQVVKKALENNRFKLLFQPIISLRGAEEEHYEVLLRMINDDNEEVSPYEFLDVAGEMGVNEKIDRWVILEAVKVLASHQKRGNNTRLLINMTAHSICDESIVPWIGVAFKAADLNPRSIVFQISEVDASNHLNAAKHFVDAITKLGAQVSVNNFGCSLNPFNTLSHVGSAFVKVDGSFTLDIQNNNESPETLINLLKQLHDEDKITVVPFVENASVLSVLWQAGVHYIQGHYLQGPASEMSYDFSTES